MMSDIVRNWYMEDYPSDELGCSIDRNIKFSHVFEALFRHEEDIYSVLGVDDSIVRERVFEKLSEIMDVDYSFIYDQWLKIY